MTLTLMMYITSFKESLAALAEPPSPSYYDDPNRYNEDGTVNRNVVSNPGIKTLATVFRNLSNACCDDQTGVLKSFMIEVGAVDAAIHFGTQGYCNKIT